MTLSTNVFWYEFIPTQKLWQKDRRTTHYLHDICLYVYLPIKNVRWLSVCANIILARFLDDDVFVWISILFNLKNEITKSDISFKSLNTNKCLKYIVVENHYIYNQKTNINYLKIKKLYNTIQRILSRYMARSYIVHNLLGILK